MTPNEQKAYEWENEFDKKFVHYIQPLTGTLRKNISVRDVKIKSFIASQISQARADERRRIEEKLMTYHNWTKWERNILSDLLEQLKK